MNAQRLAGVVFDRENNEPVINVHVYIEGSSVHAVTNLDGRFDITINSVVNLPLVISHISYETKTIFDPFVSLPDTIFVKEKANMLDEVIAQVSRYSRRQLLTAFRREFLGISQAAESCIIENEEKIDLWFDYGTHILMANCDDLVIIHNRYLGYRLYLTLEKFEVKYPGNRLGVGTPILIDFEGSTFFEDLDPFNQTIAKRRENVFLGSPSHFLLSLAYNQLDRFDYWLIIKGDIWVKKASECFTVIDMNGIKKILVTPLLVPKSHETYHGWNYYGTVQVQRARKEETQLIIFKDHFFIDTWGSPTKDLLFVGHMGSLRFGDKLPADYGVTVSKMGFSEIYKDNK